MSIAVPPRPHHATSLPPLPDPDRAACVDHLSLHPDDWWGDPKVAPTSLARETCLYDCPVRDACIEYTLANDSAYGPDNGIWAGLTAGERVRLARRRRHRRQRGLE